MYLIDTNIFLEGLLDQEKADSITHFFQKIELENIYNRPLTSLHWYNSIQAREIRGFHIIFGRYGH